MTTFSTPPKSDPRRVPHRWLLGAGLALPLLLAASCSRTSSGANSGALYVQSCSLACTDGQGGTQVACGIVNVFQNSEFSVLFSEPLNPSSVGPATFQVVNVSNGTSPDGQYIIDPLDPRRAIFRPGIVFGGGGVAFSLVANTSYEVLIPGEAQGDGGPFITSVAGNPNQSRLQCTVLTSEGVTDPVPGNPRVQIDLVQVATYDGNGDPATFRTVTLPLTGPLLNNIFRDSPVVFRFNELMNVATLADNSTLTSPFVAVEFDRDGNLTTSSSGDRRAVQGSYEFAIDGATLTTTLTFTPSEPYPSAGEDPNAPRLIVMRVPQQVVDLTNKPVLTATGGGVRAAIPEIRSFQAITLPDDGPETFATTAREDVSRSGATWSDSSGSERFLGPAFTGGSGRFGDLRVPAGTTLTLSTDSQEFPLSLGIVGNPNLRREVDIIANTPTPNYPGQQFITVTDGVFEFASLVVEAGAQLVLRGANPARLVVRGPIDIAPGSLIDASGSSAGQHDSRLAGGQTPQTQGPGAGAGGRGADRADFTASAPIRGIGGLANPGAVRDGRPGQGVGGGTVGGGGGGARFPNTYPTALTTAINGSNGQLGWNVGVHPNGVLNDSCVSLQMGGPGGGGAYVQAGSAGISQPSPDRPTIQFPTTGGSTALSGAVGAAGDNTALAIEAANSTNAGYNVRLLRWDQGHLRGGAGGGGGGNHPYMTLSEGDPPSAGNNCWFFLFGTPAQFREWYDHSGAAGGSGGGALELMSGKRIDIDGRLEARGGQGGSSLSSQPASNFGQYAMAGGGGAGGAILVRAPIVDILPGGTRFDVRGGQGGTAFWAVATPNPTGSRGGDGSRGLVRVEDGPGSPLTITQEGLRSLVEPFNTGNPGDSIQHLSVASGFFNSTVLRRPDSITASSSCWLSHPESFEVLGLRADSGPSLAEQGWTMNVVLNQGGTVVKRPFRGTTGAFPTSWESQYGNLLGYDLGVGETASPIVVRFQGARIGQGFTDGCGVDINALNGPILAGSVTRWVTHPSELNGILNQTGVGLSPNIVRYVVIFDRTNDPGSNDTPGQVFVTEGILGVDDLLLNADPE